MTLRNRQLWFWVALWIVLCGTPGAAQVELAGEGPSPVRFELVSDVDAIVPGQRLTVGIRIRHDPGWHTYWKNPGTVGLATSATWKLPEGWRAGPLIWPRPQRTEMGVYTVWGYEGEAVLLTTIDVPASLPRPARPEVLAVEVSFMVCAKTCRPGNAQLSLTLPTRGTAAAVFPWRRVFDSVRRQQPRRLPGWKVASSPLPDGMRLRLTPPQGVRAAETVEFYGATRQISSHRPHVVRRVGAVLEIDLPREEFSPEAADRLTGVLYGIGGGEARGLWVDVPWPQNSGPGRVSSPPGGR